jgi:hypothetical protein
VVIPKVEDLLPCVLLIPMMKIYFGTLGFGSYRFTHPTFFQSGYPRSGGSPATYPLDFKGEDLLQASGLWEFSLHTSIFLQKWLSVEVQDLLPRVLLISTMRIYIRTLVFRGSKVKIYEMLNPQSGGSPTTCPLEFKGNYLL